MFFSDSIRLLGFRNKLLFFLEPICCIFIQIFKVTSLELGSLLRKPKLFHCGQLRYAGLHYTGI